jgi:ribulose-phosphate 3-epimerase
MIEIIPAIMPDSWGNLVERADRVKGLAPLAQIDIMDGVFVPSKSWPYTEGGVKAEKHFIALSGQQEGMPSWEELDYEIDLMIARPEKHIDEWLPLGASRLIFHIESIEDKDAFWGHPIFDSGAREISGQKVIEVGLAVNPSTPLTEIEHYFDTVDYLGKIDFIQCMGIARIGYQGQPFDEGVLQHVNQLRNKHPNLPISVDGGVNTETAPLLKHAGATRLVAGSAIFGSGDVAEAIRALRGA